jgi:hypothetical protein
MSKLATDEIRKIGFNDTVQVARRTFHVQTEVLVVDGIVIKTTVSEAGVIRYSENHSCTEDFAGLGAFRSLVHAQHQRYVRDLHTIGMPWLAST